MSKVFVSSEKAPRARKISDCAVPTRKEPPVRRRFFLFLFRFFFLFLFISIFLCFPPFFPQTEGKRRFPLFPARKTRLLFAKNA